MTDTAPSSESPGTAPVASHRPAETALTGALVGLCHAVAETTLIGWFDAAINQADVILFAAAYALLGAGLGVGVSALAWFKRKVTGQDGGVFMSGGGKGLLFLGVVVAEGLVTVKLVAAQDAWMRSVVILAIYLPVLVVLGILLFKQRASLTATVVNLLSLSFAGVGATLAASALGDVAGAGTRFLLCVSLCVAPVIGLIVLIAMQNRFRKQERMAHAPTRLRGGMLVAGLALAMSIGLWSGLLPAGLDWHVDHDGETYFSPYSGSAARPNVLLVVLDTVRAQSLDLFGYARETMPFLKLFAIAECDYAAESFANASATLPTHASMFTGHFSHSHGAHKPFLVDENPPAYGYFLGDSLPTLAERLASAGYKTAGIPGNYGVLGSYGLRRGFGYYDSRESHSEVSRKVSWFFSLTIAGHSPGLFIINRLLLENVTAQTVAFDPWQPSYRPAEQINDLAFRWLSGMTQSPFFLFLNFMDAHDPYVPPREYRERFGALDPQVDWIGFPKRQHAEYMNTGVPIPDRDVKHALNLYDAELRYLDDQLKRLFEHLRDTERYDNTMIIVVGDHGEAFAEHDVLRHSSTLYNTQTLVPLLVKLPAASKADIGATGNMQHVDVFSTVLDLLGIEPPPDLQGSPWGYGRDYALSEIFVQRQGNPKFDRELCAVRVDNYKYISSTTGQEELYDIVADPNETRNLIGTVPEIEDRVRKIKSLRDKNLVTRLSSGTEDANLLNKLRSLGYVD